MKIKPNPYNELGQRKCVGYKIGNHWCDITEFTTHRYKPWRYEDTLHEMCDICKRKSNSSPTKQKLNNLHNPKRNPNHPTPIYAEINSFCAARARAKRILRYPTWISHPQEQQIKAIYNLRDKLNRCHGYAHWHVDHIIPLLGKEVSGLHVPENLQLIPSDVNLSKSNQWNWERQE